MVPIHKHLNHYTKDMLLRHSELICQNPIMPSGQVRSWGSNAYTLLVFHALGCKRANYAKVTLNLEASVLGISPHIPNSIFIYWNIRLKLNILIQSFFHEHVDKI